MKKSLWAVAITLVLLAYSSVVAADVTQSRRQEIKQFVLEECTYCHGMKLQGDVGPPLQHYNLRLLPDGYIAEYIRVGRPGTRMRSWGDAFTREELKWLAQWLKREKLSREQMISQQPLGCERQKNNC
ncbi:MAG: c-type cytochrome [Gammaproteobacteria bacterium]|nr:c-type cytochrome [Gammaproteobacteria bacterium]